ncbi:unnamed protein product [Pieris brassicae]|uniref:Odorant receptor n=1 Tax=Pieris brassicae TaxID=7116 RepID=A0A9P0XGU2_PIEBR|nr:unnamed protein product [Pieris brassicae]
MGMMGFHSYVKFCNSLVGSRFLGPQEECIERALNTISPSDRSKAIGDAVYFSRWEDGITQVPGVRSSILMILARCNKPLVLSAGGMYDLSLQGYATLANESVFRRLASTMNSPNFDLSTDERKKIFEMWQRRNEGHVKLILGLGTCTIIACNTSELRDILSAPMLAQLAVSTTLICSIGYQLVATSMNVNITKWLMSLLYLGYNMFGLYILCRWCEEVKIQSIAVGEAVYFSGWERGITQVPGVRSSILLILARCNKPLVLSAGGMYDLSLEAYATMIKTSYSALTVLLRFRQS